MPDRKFLEVPIESLVCRAQVRESTGLAESDIADLARAITEAGGIMEPLLVRRDGAELVVYGGERRLRAAKLLVMKTVPVIVDETEFSESEVLHRQLVLDVQHVALNPMERARAIDRLVTQTGWSLVLAAKKLGCSPPTISRLRALCLLPPEVQAQVAAGTLAASTAYEIAKVADSGKRQELAKDAVAKHLSRKSVVSEVRGRRVSDASSKKRSPRERFVLPLRGNASVTIAGCRLSVEAVMAAFEELLGKLRAVAKSGQPWPEIAKSLRRAGSKEAKGAAAT